MTMEIQKLNYRIKNGLLKKGWIDSDRSGFSPAENEDIKIAAPPIILNEIFNIPVGNSINLFALFTEFEVNNSDLSENLAIHLAWIGENWAIYINGRELRNEIHLSGINEILTYKTYRGINIPIKRGYLHPNKNIIVIHILGNSPATIFASNDNTGLLFSEPYTITTQTDVGTDRAEVLYISLYMVYFFFGLYHLLIFIRRPREAYNLFFSTFSIALATYGFSQTMFINELFENTEWIIRLKYASQPTMIPPGILFLHSYFFLENKRGVFVDLISLIGASLAMFFLFTPYRFMETGLQMFYFTLALPALIYGTGQIVVAILKKKKDTGIMSFSLILMILTATLEVVDAMTINTGIRLLKYDFFAFVISLVAIMANRFLRVHNESERLNVELTRQKYAFLRFDPTQFVELPGKKSAVEIDLGDSSIQTMSVLLCDLRSFTNLAEHMTPEETFDFLNSYLAHMEPAIQRYEGFVDKFIGDAILALFSDFGSEGQYNETTYTSADRSLNAALEMRRALVIYNQENVVASGKPVDFGIGINTGPLVIGTVGSQRRIDSTVIGNTVNLASRVETLTKFYHASVIITNSTYSDLSAPQTYCIHEINIVVVQGKTEPSIIYEVFDTDPEPVKQAKLSSLPQLKEAIQYYCNQDFRKALEVLVPLQEAASKNDKVIDIYVKRCQNLIQNPPAGEWKGIFEIQH